MPWITAYLSDAQLASINARLDKLINFSSLGLSNQDKQTRLLGEILVAVKSGGSVPSLAGIESLLSGIKFSLGRPGRLGLLQVGEDSMSKIIFEVALPGLAAPDVVKRELSVQIGTEPVSVVTLEGATLSDATVTNLKGTQDSPLHLELVDIDDAGNRSQPSVYDAVLADTFAPPAPGALGIKAIGEDFTVEPAPEPPAPPVEPPVEPTV